MPLNTNNKQLFLIVVFSFSLLTCFTQNLVINEFSSLNSHILDEDNDTPDWFEIANFDSEGIELGNYSVSDDETLINKWQLPDITLNPNEHLLIFASGKDKRVQNVFRNLITQGDTFAYAIGSENIADNWKTKDFNDSVWDKGASGFGYGDDDDATELDFQTLSVFIRKSFIINTPSEINQILLHIDYDDGFVAYINNIEIARSNLGVPNSMVPYNQTADGNHEATLRNNQTPEIFTIENIENLLIEGENILAIQGHNTSNTSSDLSLTPFLSVACSNNSIGSPMPQILNIENQNYHSNFKISSDGEALYLLNSTGSIIDQTDSILLPSGISYGRTLADKSKWAYFAEPTPGSINSTNSYNSIGNQLISFSPTGGKYTSTKQVALTGPVGSDIYFTTDGSTPSIESEKYTSPISLSETTVIKAMVISENALSVSASVETYIITPRKLYLPVISLSTNADNLFDWETGILVDGPNWQSSMPHYGANYWEDWERPIYIEYFNADGVKVFESPGGTKVFGGWSRANEQKSMALFARKAYGSKSFDYKFFNDRKSDKYKSMVLRNSGNDNGHTHFRDAMMTGLVRNIDIDRQAYQPTITMINGEYWGILNMREKVNEDYLEQNHAGVKADKVDILTNNMEVVEGSNEHYIDMINYISSNGLSDNDHFDHIKTLIDINSYMEYQIAQIYYNNQDWPGNNIKFWRPQTENGRWRWVLYDTDFGFGGYGGSNSSNTLAFALYEHGTGWPNPAWSTFLFRSLAENESFVQEFANRFADRLNHDFHPEKVTYFIDSLRNNIKIETAYHKERWGNLWGFNDNVEDMINFGIGRPNFMRTHIKNEFSLGRVVDLNVNVSDQKHGKIQVNSLNINEYPWEGKYFSENPLPITAIPEPGYEFSHWDGHHSSSAHIVINIPNEGLDLRAVFKVSDNTYNSVVINEINYSSSETKNCNDWIELFNTTKAPLDISGWKLKDSDDIDTFEFPMGSIIPAYSYLIVCENINSFHEVYPEIYESVGNFKFGLSSTTDMVRLYNKQNVLIDSVAYFNEQPWPEITVEQTIALYNPFIDNTAGSSWITGSESGSPGHDNEHFTKIDEIKNTQIEAIIASCFPNPTQGNATVRWHCDAAQNVSISIFNIQGQKIQTVLSDYCPEGIFEQKIAFDNTQQSGIYFVKLTLANGGSTTLKLIKN